MKREVQVDKKSYQVEYEKTAGGINVAVNGRCYQVDASALSGGFYSLLVNNRSCDAFVSREKESFSVVVAGRTMEVDFYDPRSRQPAEESKRSAGVSRQVIRAPMAGRIVRFQVGPGELVQDGQGLIVLEAMKMENELKSQGIGQVREILVTENEVVVPGQQLMVIE
ncbi:MAG: biotin/lipoyl-containing protein [Thermodesulfobacteriota bacterium]